MVTATITKSFQHSQDNHADAGGGKGTRCIGVIGSRTLPAYLCGRVGEIAEDLLDRGFHIATGGAVGTDEFCLARLVHIGMADHATIHTPWKNYEGFPVRTRALARQFREFKGSILWGSVRPGQDYNVIRSALLERNVRLVNACHGIVAFLHGDSRGTLFVLSQAIKIHMPIVVVPFDRELPEFPSVRWKPLLCGGCWEGGYKAVYLK